MKKNPNFFFKNHEYVMDFCRFLERGSSKRGQTHIFLHISGWHKIDILLGCIISRENDFFFSREMTICQTGKKVLSAIVNKHRALQIVWKMDYIILCCICLLWKKRITYVFKKYIINLIRYNKADVKIKKHDFGIFCLYFFLPKKVLCCIFLTQQLNLQNLNYERMG